MSVNSTMNLLKAENLMSGSYILTQIAELKASVSLPSDGKKLNFDDYFDYLQKEIDAIPRIELLTRVPNEQESNYTVQLIEALDELQERVTLVQNKVVAFQTRLVEVETAVKEVSGAFDAWYTLAVHEYLGSTDLKLPVATIKALSASEFSRLMGGTVIAISTLQVALKAEVTRLEGKRKMAQKKFELGREQVNASWANQLPEMVGISSAPGSMRILKGARPVVEDDVEGPVSFVSKRQRISDQEQSSGVITAPQTVLEEESDHVITVYAEATPRTEPAVLGETPEEGNPNTGEEATVAAQSVLNSPAPLCSEVVDAAFLFEQGQVGREAQCLQTSGATPASSVASVPTPYIGVDLGSEPSKKVISIQDRETGEVLASKAFTEDHDNFLAMEEVLKQVEATHPKIQAKVDEQKSKGFVKYGTPQPAVEVTPAVAVATFNDGEDDGIEEPDPTEEIEEDESALISAEEAEIMEEVPRKAASPSLPVEATVMLKDELDDLVPPVTEPSEAPTPVAETTPTPVAVPAKRKPLTFSYSDDDL